MKSYAAIESFESTHAVLELELHSMEESKNMSVSEKRTRIVHIPFNLFPDTNEAFCEGDVAIVEHEAGFIVGVCGKDDEEKERRIERIRKIKETFRKKD